ncbi:MAG TPA: type 1 glutamine amidotransferase [Candidatus Pullichristensenella stercorigallinarum]|uniref:Type 1 glutamine amidotransferase n=1 Tax=Candidatus Pullichristensenella stercorigallinarum TaxID=2840909 RepID=A0A9D0ZMR8_9FIRM|nr:type 1 glutamine amidotransferase [Candidatus Pullichristensenella stercorigallinarum]
MNNTYGIPRVGLLPYSRADGSQYFPPDYIEAIEMTGAEVVPVMHDTPLDTLYPLVVSLDAMIFSGGCDVDPVHYGQAREPGCGRIDPRRDQIELALADLVLGRNIPVLGICRGLQMLNVVLGGTLKQDIPNHRVSETSDDPIWHDVRIDPSSRLAQIAGTDRARVNSYHHQAIDRLADGLVATAWAEDGTIEAMEMPGERFFVGLQWHPEKSLREDELSKAVFKAMRAAMH